MRPSLFVCCLVVATLFVSPSGVARAAQEPTDRSLPLYTPEQMHRIDVQGERWAKLVAKIEPGMRRADAEKLLLHGKTVGTTVLVNGGSQTYFYRVDAHWAVTIYYNFDGAARDAHGTIMEAVSPENKVLDKPILSRSERRQPAVTSAEWRKIKGQGKRWERLLTRIKPGMRRADVERVLGRGWRDTGLSVYTGGSQSASYKMDAHWVISLLYGYNGAKRDEHGTVIEKRSPDNQVLGVAELNQMDRLLFRN